MGKTRMSEAQRTAVLASDATRGPSRGWLAVNQRTERVMIRDGRAVRLPGAAYAITTRAALVEAGVDMDALHVEAIIENGLRICDALDAEAVPVVDPLAEQVARDEHSSTYWETATAGLPREAAFPEPADDGVEAISAGDTVVRVGEPDGPRGIVSAIEVYSIGRQAVVSFSSMLPISISVDKLRRVPHAAAEPLPAEMRRPHAYLDSGFFAGLCGICGHPEAFPRHGVTEAAVAELSRLFDEAKAELDRAPLFPVMMRALALAAGRPQTMSTRFGVSNPPLVTRGLIVEAPTMTCGYRATPLGAAALRVLGIIETDLDLAEWLDLDRRVEVWSGSPARECCEGDEYGHADTCPSRPAEVAELAERTAAESPAERSDDLSEVCPPARPAAPSDAELNQIVYSILRDAATPGEDLPPYEYPATVEYSKAMVAWHERVLARRRVLLDRMTALDEGARRRHDLPLFASWTIGHARAGAESDVKDWQRHVVAAMRDFERDHGMPYAPAEVAVEPELPKRERPAGEAAAVGEDAPEVHLDREGAAACGLVSTPSAQRTSLPAALTCVQCLDVLWDTAGAASTLDATEAGLRRIAGEAGPAPARAVATGYVAAEAVREGLVAAGLGDVDPAALKALTGGLVMEARLVEGPLVWRGAPAEPTLDEVPAEPRDLPHIG